MVACSFLFISFGNASNYIPVVALKSIAAEFDWPRAIPAAAYSVSMIGAGIGGVFIGRWTDRVGIALPLAVGVSMIGLGCIVTSQITNAWTFLLAQGVLVGLLGNAALYGPLVSNVTRWFDRRRGLAVGLVATGQTVAGAVWTPIFRVSMESTGWRDTFFYYGVFVIVAMLPLTLLMRRRAPAISLPSGGRALSEGESALGLPSSRLQVLLCVAIVGCCVSMSMPLVHLVSHVSDLGFGLASGASALSVALAGAFISRLSWGWISDRIGGMATLLITSIWQASALFALTIVDSLAGLYVLAAYFGLGYGGIVPAYAIIVREYFADGKVGQRIGLVILFGTIGMALGSWLAGAIYDWRGNYFDAFLVGYLFNLFNIAIVFFLMARAGSDQKNPGAFKALG